MQEELKILRLRYSILQEEELENREKELIDMLNVKQDASVSSLPSCFNVLHASWILQEFGQSLNSL